MNELQAPRRPAASDTDDPAARKTLLDLFTERVAATPDATAVSDTAGGTTSFEVLAASASDISSRLRRCGVGVGGRVGVGTRVHATSVAVLLAIIEIGAAMVAFDPAGEPSTAVDAVVRDGDTGEMTVMAASCRAPSSFDGAVHLLHIVNTSGTTGDSKHVGIRYRAALNRFEWGWREYQLSGTDVLLAHKAPGLVTAPWEMLGGVLAGVRTQHLSRDVLVDPQALAAALLDTRVTHVFGNPYLVENLVEGGTDGRALKLVASGGDVLHPALVRRFHATYPDVPLVNLYGTSETSSTVTAFDTAALDADATIVPAGTPVSGAVITVRDRNLRIVPDGVRGDVVIEGVPVAAGYIGAGDDEERFPILPDGSRACRSGDIGRWNQNGVLEVIGRGDNVIKIRGYRVALEEVEAALRTVEGVAEVALHLAGAGSASVLVALVAAGPEFDLGALRSEVGYLLPSYAVPGRVVRVDRLPRTANQKVDRSAVAAAAETAAWSTGPEPSGGQGGDDPAAEALAGAWATLLGAPPTSSEANFFAEGGHSLMLLQLVQQVRDATGVAMTVRELVLRPTFAEMLLHLSEADEHFMVRA